jgi:hypothetical protein
MFVLGLRVAGQGLCFPRSPNARDLGHPFSCWVKNGWLRFVLSHLRRKSKNAPKVGHPIFVLRTEGQIKLCYPTLNVKNTFRVGHPCSW